MSNKEDAASEWESEAERLHRERELRTRDRSGKREFQSWLSADENAAGRGASTSRILLNLADFYGLLRSEFSELGLRPLGGAGYALPQGALRELRRIWPKLPALIRLEMAQHLAQGTLDRKRVSQLAKHFSVALPGRVLQRHLDARPLVSDVDPVLIQNQLFEAVGIGVAKYFGEARLVRSLPCTDRLNVPSLRADAIWVFKNSSGRVFFGAVQIVEDEAHQLDNKFGRIGLDIAVFVILYRLTRASGGTKQATGIRPEVAFDLKDGLGGKFRARGWVFRNIDLPPTREDLKFTSIYDFAVHGLVESIDRQ